MKKMLWLNCRSDMHGQVVFSKTLDMVIGQGHISAESSVNGLMLFLALTIKKMVISWGSKKAFILFETFTSFT